MRVFNKEVTMCARCPHINQPDNGYHSESCNYEDLVDIEDPHVIAKNCPFNKPITKEVIEGFGFVNTKQYSDELVFQKNISDYEFYELSLQEDNKVIIEYWSQERLVAKVLSKETWGCFNVFAGTINNPVELEFILCSIGVIE